MRIFQLFILSCVLCGCQSPRMDRVKRDVTEPLKMRVSAAHVANDKAAAKLEVAAEKVQAIRLQVVAGAVAGKLDEVAMDLGEAKLELAVAGDALAFAEEELDVLKVEVEQVQNAFDKERAARVKEESAAAFWKGAAVKLGMLSLVFGVWIVRRPVGALFGVPVP